MRDVVDRFIAEFEYSSPLYLILKLRQVCQRILKRWFLEDTFDLPQTRSSACSSSVGGFMRHSAVMASVLKLLSRCLSTSSL